MASEKTLIDLEAARGYVQTFIADPILKMAANAVLNNAPRVDAVEVVHGRWIGSGHLDFFCSVCGVYQSYLVGMTNYCPNCGAKMDGDGNG